MHNPTDEVIDRLISIDELTPHPRNYKRHPASQVERLAASLQAFGQPRTIAVWRGTILAGHGVTQAAQHLGWQQIRASIVPDSWTEARAQAYVVADNETQRGAEIDEVELAALLDEARLEIDLEAMGFDAAAFDALLAGLTEDAAIEEQNRLKEQRNKLAAPGIPVDLIYTFAGGNGSCCIARAAGMSYGVRSTDKSCVYCKPIFIDNHYHKYDHDHHVSVIREYRPKYATVRDVMTQAQCADAGIEYYSLDQILEWAAELSEYTENVIVIPKYQCLDQIPDRYVLGYSVPTSYGGTPLPISAFSGRRVHLLGGEPRLQVEYWRELGPDVVSIDNNYIQRKSQFGMVLTEDFNWVQLYDYGDMASLPNPWHVCLAVNCGRMMQLFRQPVPVNPDQTLED